MVEITRLSKYKNLLSVYGVFIMIVLVLLNIEQIQGIIDVFQTIIIVALPLGTSDIFWNKKNYEIMTPEKGNFFQKSNFSYNLFMWVGFILILVFDIGMTLGVYNHIFK